MQHYSCFSYSSWSILLLLHWFHLGNLNISSTANKKSFSGDLCIKMRNMIKDENDLLQVSLQGHLHNAFFLCDNTVLLLKKEIKESRTALVLQWWDVIESWPAPWSLIVPLVVHPPVSSSSTRASGRPASSVLSWWRWNPAAYVWTPEPRPNVVRKHTVTSRMQWAQKCGRSAWVPCFYHHGEDNGSLGSLDDPQQDQAAELDDGEEVHLPQRDVAKVDEVRLMFGRHAEQLQTVEELHGHKHTQLSEPIFFIGVWKQAVKPKLSSPECLAARKLPCTERLHTAQAWE